MTSTRPLTYPLRRDQKNIDPKRPKFITDLVARAADNTGWDKSKFLSRREVEVKANTERVKENIKIELENLDMIHRFTTMLVEAGHTAAAEWMFPVIQSRFEVGPGTWRKQIHTFATRWIMWLTRYEHESGLDTKKVRTALAAEADPFVWLGNLEEHLVPLIMENHLFMDEQALREFIAANSVDLEMTDGTKVFEITPDGPQQVAATPSDLSIVTGQSPQ